MNNELTKIKIIPDLSDSQNTTDIPIQLSIKEYEQLIAQKELELLNLKLEYKEYLNSIMNNKKEDDE